MASTIKLSDLANSVPDHLTRDGPDPQCKVAGLNGAAGCMMKSRDVWQTKRRDFVV